MHGKKKPLNHVLTNKLKYLPIVFDLISLSEFVSSDGLTETMSFMGVLDPFSELPIR